MNTIFLQNNSQKQNDDLILEFIFFFIFIALLFYCIYNYKNVSEFFQKHFPVNDFRSFRLYPGLFMIIVICIKLSFDFILKICCQ